ncbi:hypothetical protein DFH28DRAFT_898520 [Melampsora americana]|nr:hypothetical protein DFH28DRAFT_898520 [Melampsora americana]
MALWNMIFICTHLSFLRYTQATLENQIRSTQRGTQHVPQSYQDRSGNAIDSEDHLQKRDLLNLDSELSHVIRQTFHPAASTESTGKALDGQQFSYGQHLETGTADLSLEPTFSGEWTSWLMSMDGPSPHFSPPAEVETPHASPTKLQSSNYIASPELLITSPRTKRKFTSEITVDDDVPKIGRQTVPKHQAFARKMTDAFIQSKTSSYDMKSIAQAYFRAQEREDVKPENCLPADFFGQGLAHSADDPPHSMRSLGKSNIDMMILYEPKDFDRLMDTWTKQGFNSDGDFFANLENEAELNFEREMYSETLVAEASSVSQFVSDVKRSWSRQLPLTYNYETVIEMGKATEFWSVNKIFTESEALKALEKLDKLLLSNPVAYVFGESWLNEFSVPQGLWNSRIEHLKDLEKKSQDRILQSIAYSKDLRFKGIAGEEAFNAAALAGFNAKIAWKQLAKLPPYSPSKSKMLNALKDWGLLMKDDSENKVYLENKVLLEAAVKYHSTVVTEDAFRRNDLTGADLALSTWIALHDANLSKDSIKKALEQRVPDFAQAERLLQQGTSVRLQIQSLVAIVFPWMYERYHALPTTGHQHDFSLAASTFLMMRKRLNNVLQFSPEERVKFKTELIEFLGTENYDQRMKQVIRISDELRHAINMRNMLTLAVNERFEVAPRKHWYHYLGYLNRLRENDHQTFKRLVYLYESFSKVPGNTMPPFSMKQFYDYISRCAHSYISDILLSSIAQETAADLTETNWKLFKVAEQTNENILALIQETFPPESRVKSSYLLTHGIRRKAAENYQGLLRWREKYRVLIQTMSDDFVGWIRKLDSTMISISDDRFEQKRYPGYRQIYFMTREAEARYQLINMLKDTLGLHFFENRRDLILHRTRYQSSKIKEG